MVEKSVKLLSYIRRILGMGELARLHIVCVAVSLCVFDPNSGQTQEFPIARWDLYRLSKLFTDCRGGASPVNEQTFVTASSRLREDFNHCIESEA